MATPVLKRALPVIVNNDKRSKLSNAATSSSAAAPLSVRDFISLFVNALQQWSQTIYVRITAPLADPRWTLFEHGVNIYLITPFVQRVATRDFVTEVAEALAKLLPVTRVTVDLASDRNARNALVNSLQATFDNWFLQYAGRAREQLMQDDTALFRYAQILSQTSADNPFLNPDKVAATADGYRDLVWFWYYSLMTAPILTDKKLEEHLSTNIDTFDHLLRAILITNRQASWTALVGTDEYALVTDSYFTAALVELLGRVTNKSSSSFVAYSVRIPNANPELAEVLSGVERAIDDYAKISATQQPDVSQYIEVDRSFARSIFLSDKTIGGDFAIALDYVVQLVTEPAQVSVNQYDNERWMVVLFDDVMSLDGYTDADAIYNIVLRRARGYVSHTSRVHAEPYTFTTRSSGIFRLNFAVNLPHSRLYSQVLYPVLINFKEDGTVDTDFIPSAITPLELRVQRQCIRCNSTIDTGTMQAAVGCQWLWSPSDNLSKSNALARSPTGVQTVTARAALTFAQGTIRTRLLYVVDRAARQLWIAELGGVVVDVLRRLTADIVYIRELYGAAEFTVPFNMSDNAISAIATINQVNVFLDTIANDLNCLFQLYTGMPYGRALRVASVTVDNYTLATTTDPRMAIERETTQQAIGQLIQRWTAFGETVQVFSTNLNQRTSRADIFALATRPQWEQSRLYFITWSAQEVEQNLRHHLVNHSIAGLAQIDVAPLLSVQINLASILTLQRELFARSHLGSRRLYIGSHATYTIAPSLALLQVTCNPTDADALLRTTSVVSETLAPSVPYLMQVLDKTSNMRLLASEDSRSEVVIDTGVPSAGGVVQKANFSTAPPNTVLSIAAYGAGIVYTCSITFNKTSKLVISAAVPIDVAVVRASAAAATATQIQNAFDLLLHKQNILSGVQELTMLIQRLNDLLFLSE